MVVKFRIERSEMKIILAVFLVVLIAPIVVSALVAGMEYPDGWWAFLWPLLAFALVGACIYL